MLNTYGLSEVPIKDPGIKAVRSLHSKAVLSNDIAGLQAYRDRETQMLRTKDTEYRLGLLEGQMGEVKELLNLLVTKVCGEGVV